ncbi:MAG: peptidoglycan DD-metalloendopeptidase family protein [Candidatus Cloacimonetes bacterium]|nr:peptidoglycan DD-metalloendopeptidase family protein [Candidatus Cloacimonadota bacterium]
MSTNPKYITESNSYHIAKKGDTIKSISNNYHISEKNLKLYNELTSERIFPGQKIYLEPKAPSKNEFITKRSIPKKKYYIVRKGDTLSRIAKMYDIYIFDLVDFNNLNDFSIKKGQKIWLIAQQKSITVNSNSKEKIEKPSNTNTSAEKPETNKSIEKRNQKENSTAPKKEGKLFLPLKGIVTSEFGMRNGRPHKGIDIAAPTGNPIYAALSGKVVISGVQRGYGNVIIIEHSDKIMTVYAHNESNLVRVNDQVKRGQPIATVGKTGIATGPHLHFEYRKNGKAKNPRKYLTGL